MFIRSFRFDSSRLRAAFAPRKPRHPLLRIAMSLLGLAVLCVLVFFGVFVGAAMIGAGMLFKLLAPRRKPIDPQARVVEGEYRVVRKPVLPLTR